jgi:signal transduction histidine kinase
MSSQRPPATPRPGSPTFEAGRLTTHDHLAILFDERADADGAAASFVRAGLLRGERCLWLLGGRSQAGAREALVTAGLDVDGEEARRTLRLLAIEGDGAGAAPISALSDLAERSCAEALRDGSAGLRVIVDAGPALTDAISADDLASVEAGWGDLAGRLPLCVMCLHDAHQLSPRAQGAALRTHPLLVVDCELCSNPYFDPPHHDPGPPDPSRELARRLRHVRRACRAERERVELVREQAARIAAEEARRQVERDRQRLRAVFQHAPVGILFLDTRQERIIANPAANALFGRAIDPDAGRQQLVGAVLDAAGVPLPLDELPSSRAARGQLVEHEALQIERPDGQRLSVRASAVPVQHPDLAAVEHYEDTTAARELERLRDEWAAIVAHDMAQPVSAIRLQAAGLARAAVAGEAGVEHARRVGERIATMADRLGKMLGDLVDVSRLEAGRLELERRPLDLAGLVHAVLERSAGGLGGRSVRMEVGGALPTVLADAARLEQVLLNLLSNAAKYGVEGAPIEVALRPRDGGVEVAVTNAGAGIDADVVPQLFRRFSRAPRAKSGKVPGLGLGLYISRQLVEAHGGRICVDSPPAGPTTFRFTLPASANQVASASP